MTALAIVLLAIGAGDLTHGLAGIPTSRRRAVLAVLVSSVVAVVAVAVNDGSGQDAVVTTTVTVVVAAAWQLSRVAFAAPQLHLAVIGVGVGAATVLSTLHFPGRNGWWGDALEESRIALIRETHPARVLLTLAVGVFMIATANAIVRVVLDVVIDGEPPTTRIRGGRVIGPLERLLIVGFVVAGQPTTAALVVTAKSLLRYPELRSHDDVDVHAVTEYVLIGSLMSWALALAATIPLV